ncbi:MAG: zinc ribbon domain-containing protein [Haloarculaceae archaeon]
MSGGSGADGASERGIAAVGAYAPALRIDADSFAEAWGSSPKGIESKSVPDADEDALTMGAEAARRALAAGDREGAEVGFLAFATTTPPLEEEDLTARLGSVLGVVETAVRQSFGASTRAGTRALVAGLDATYDGPGLVVAADCPRGESDDDHEHAAGAGAAAFILDPGAPAEVIARSEYAIPYPGTRFRRAGSGSVEGLDVTSYDRRAFSEALGGAVEGLDADTGGVDAAAVQAPDGGMPYRAAGALGVDAETVGTCATVQDLGDTGAASVPLSLARALTDGHDRVLAASFGSGAGADALVVERRGEVPVDLDLDGNVELSYPEYLQRRGEITPGEPNGGGAYVPVPTWRRSLPQRHRLVAGRCPECGGLTFPPEGACNDCGALDGFEDTPLSGPAEVRAITTIGRGGAPPEFAEQQARSGDFQVAIVAFETGDEEATAPAQVVSTATVEAGDRVDPIVRRIYTQEGVTRYGFKLEPAE